MKKCANNQPKIPATTNRLVISGEYSATRRIRNNKAVNNITTKIVPAKPKISPITAKIESLIASGK